MIWKIEKIKRHVFARNPLDTVVAQLRFQPILRIGEGKGIADFQELVRTSFPGFIESEIRNLTISPQIQVTTKTEKVFHFMRNEDTCKVQLASDNVLIESKNHNNRDELIKDMRTAIRALLDVYSPIDSLRFGIRYVNVIRKDVVSEGLAREATWENLVSGEYLRMPAEIADLEATSFTNQISSPMTVGSMTLRYGLQRKDLNSPATFNFDLDRYIDGHVDTDNLDEIMTLFTDDIFSLFSTLPGIDLTEWMSKDISAAKSEGVH